MFKKGGIIGMQTLIERMDELEKKLYEDKGYLKQTDIDRAYVECVKCGCLIYKVDRNKGKGEIKQRQVFKRYWQVIPDKEDYIYYPYYCKIHKPKDKLPNTSKNKK